MSYVPTPPPYGPGQEYKVRLVPMFDKISIGLDALYQAGWTDETLVEKDHATWIEDKEPLPCTLCDGGGYASVGELTRQLVQRAQHGFRKYGATLDRTDLSLSDWLQHKAEENMDAAGYALAAKREAEKLMKIKGVAEALCSHLANDGRTLHLDAGARRMLADLSQLLGVKAP